MRASNEGTSVRTWRRIALGCVLGGLVLATVWTVVPQSDGWREVEAQRDGEVDKGWLRYSKPAKPGEPKNPIVLRLIADILAEATNDYEATSDDPLRDKLLEVVDEAHACMAGKHATDRDVKYDALAKARTNAKKAASMADWQLVLDGLMHGHD